MQVNEHRQTLLANNMANASTVGFKQDLAVVMQRRPAGAPAFAGLPPVQPVWEQMTGGANVQPTHQSFVQGPIEATGRALDVAIEGDGFFVVRDGETTRYTRDGRFATNKAGELVLGVGDGRWKVLDENSAAIGVDPSRGKPAIAADGTIRQGGTTVARLGLMTAQDKQSFRKVGANLFVATGGEPVPAGGRLRAESVEGANFDMMQGLASMIEASRAYQLNATMIQLQDQATGQAVETVGRVA